LSNGATLKLTIFGEDKSASKALKGVGKEAESTEGKLNKLGKADSVKRVGKEAEGVTDKIKGLAKAVAGLAVLGFAKSSIQQASDLNEVVSKSGKIFKGSADEIQTWSETAAESVGLSQRAALDAASQFGNMFTQIGFASDAAAELSTKTVQMAADLGSFNNVPTAQVADSISSALRGEYDALQALVPTIDNAAVNQEALAETGKKLVSQLTLQERATALLTLIQRDGALAMGDFADTADETANKAKTLSAQWEEFQGTVGTALLPAFDAAMDAASPLVDVLGKLAGWFGSLPAPIQTGALALAGWVVVFGKVKAAWAGLAGAGIVGKLRAMAAAVWASIGPVGVAIVGVTAAVALLTMESAKAEAAVTDFSGAVDENTGKLRENAAEIVAQATKDAATKYREIGGQAGDYTKALLGNADAQERVHDRILDAAQAAVIQSGQFKGTAAEARVFASEQLASGDATSALGSKMTAVLGVSAQFAADQDNMGTALQTSAVAASESAAAIEDQGGATEEAVDPMQNLADATKEMGGAASDADVASQFLKASLDALNGGAVSATEAANRNEAAFRGIGSAIRDVADAQADVQDKTDALSEAQSNLGKSLEDGGTTAEDVAAAERDLADAHDKVADAQAGVFDANVRARDSAAELAGQAAALSIANGDLQGATVAASAVIEDQRHKFIDAQVAAGMTEQAAYDLAQQLYGIPGEVATKITEEGAKKVQDEAANTTGAINDIPDSHNTDVTISGGAEAEARRIRSELNSIPGNVFSSVTVERNEIVYRQPGAMALRAEGGSIEGGIPGKDSVPVMAMPGEHMLTTSDVDKMGGQEGVYKFRKALQSGRMKFMAAGGAVSRAALAGYSPRSFGQREGVTRNAFGGLLDWLQDLQEKARTTAPHLAGMAAAVTQVYQSQGRARDVMIRLNRVYDDQVKKLDDFKDRLSTLQGNRSSMVASTRGSIAGFGGGILGFSEQRVTAGSIVNGLKFNAGKIRTFSKNIQLLRSKGLAPSLLAQIAGGGEDGMRVAATLAQASRTQIRQANSYAAQAAGSAGYAAGVAGDAVYGKAIAAQQREVTRLTKANADLSRTVRDMAQAMENGLALRIDAAGMARVVRNGERVLARRGS
jgi:hypothetical protein